MAKAVLQKTVCGLSANSRVFKERELHEPTQLPGRKAGTERNFGLGRTSGPAVDGRPLPSVHPLGPSNLVGACGNAGCRCGLCLQWVQQPVSSHSESLSAA